MEVGQAEGWRRTHRVRAEGARAWTAAQPDSAEAPALTGGLAVQVLESRSFGWTQVRCENGWVTWVDAASLEPVVDHDAGDHDAGDHDAGELDLGWVQMMAPALREPPGPGGYPSEVWAVIPPSYVPEDAPTAPSVPVPPVSAAPAAPRRFPTKLVTIVFSVSAALGLAALGFFRAQSGPGGAGADLASFVMVVLMVAVFGVSLIGIRQPARCRPLLEVLRAAASLAGVVLLGRVTKAAAPAAVLVAALAAGAAAGVLEGAFTKVAVGRDQRRYARRAVVPMVVSFVGLLVGVAAAVGGGVPGVRFGQVVGLVGIGLMVGVPIGRTMNQRTVQVATAAAGAMAAIVAAAVLLPLALAAELAGAQQASLGVDGRYEGKLVVDPDGASKNFESLSSSVDLRLAGDTLTGTVVSASEDHLTASRSVATSATRSCPRPRKTTRMPPVRSR